LLCIGEAYMNMMAQAMNFPKADLPAKLA